MEMRGVMSRIYKVGILRVWVTKTPVLHLETRCKTNYRAIVITPTQTFNILKSLTNNLHTLWCSPAARRHFIHRKFSRSACADILWLEEGIRLSKRWVKGIDGETKTEAADGYVPLQSQSWRTTHGGGAARHPTRRIRILSFLP